MKVSQIRRGSELAYLEAVDIVRDQILFELETCERMLGRAPIHRRSLSSSPRKFRTENVSGQLSKRQTKRIRDSPR